MRLASCLSGRLSSVFKSRFKVLSLHLYVKQPTINQGMTMQFHAHRPNRSTLCTGRSPSFGSIINGNDPAYVTCKSCLKMLDRPGVMSLREEPNGDWTAYSGAQPVAVFQSWEEAIAVHNAAAAKMAARAA